MTNDESMLNPISKYQNLRERLAEHSALHSTFFGGKLNWLCSNLKNDTIAIDIGAYVGDTTMFLAMQEKVKSVYAYEPIPSNFRKLSANVNNTLVKDKVKVFNNFVFPGKKSIVVPEKLAGSGIRISDMIRNKKGASVKTISLDEILRKIGHRSAGKIILKCDAEASEANIFSSSDLSGIYKMQIETHNSNEGELMRTLKSKGFSSIYRYEYSSKRQGKVGQVYAVPKSNAAELKLIS